MKCFPAVALLLVSALVQRSEAFCYMRGVSEGATHCQDQDDDTWHPIGSSWRNSQCMNCDCSGCCSAYSIPKSFPEDCEAKLDYKECVYRVTKKDDPSVECPILSAVGK